MSHGIVTLGEIARGLRGKLVVTLHRGAPEYVTFAHVEVDGRAGGKLVIKLDEVAALTALLSNVQAIAGGAKPARHSTISAVQTELALDRKLF